MLELQQRVGLLLFRSGVAFLQVDRVPALLACALVGRDFLLRNNWMHMDLIDCHASTRLEWISYHIFHGSLAGEQVLRELVLPVVCDLWTRRRFARFFFLRYGEGGPHIRLRFLSAPEYREDIDTALKIRVIEEFNCDDDCGCRVIESPFEPETQRYGGTEAIRHSFDFFCLTSAFALQQIERTRGEAKSKLLALNLRVLVRQVLGFAADENDLLRLTAYMVNGEWRGRLPLEERADREFERRAEDYVRLLAEEIEYFLDPEARSRLGDGMLTDAALLLNQRLRGVSDQGRWRIMGSQIHMTWNRMGIRNLEEVYLGRILWRALQDVVRSDNPLRSIVTGALADPKIHCEAGFDAMIPAGLSQLCSVFRQDT